MLLKTPGRVSLKIPPVGLIFPFGCLFETTPSGTYTYTNTRNFAMSEQETAGKAQGFGL